MDDRKVALHYLIGWIPLTITNLLVSSHCPVVDQCVIVEEEPAGDVESDEDVDAVVLMRRQDEEHSKAVEQPSEGVEEIDSTTRVLRDEEVQQSQRHSVTGEHVVSASPDFQIMETWKHRLF